MSGAHGTGGAAPVGFVGLGNMGARMARRLVDAGIAVDLSTASPESTVALADEAAARGVAFLDAGISGGAPAAENGTLTIMAGGDSGAVGAVRPLLERLAATVLHLGPTGTGHTGTASHLGYGDVISNRVVDALGDLAGGIRIQQPAAAGENTKES